VKGPLLRVCFAVAAFGSAACATAGGGGAQTKLLVTTEPAGATLFVNGANMGPTPVTLQVKPEEHSLALRLVREGFQEAQVTVTRRNAGPLETSLPIEGEPIDRTRGGSSSEALGAAAIAAAVTAIDRKTGSAGTWAQIATTGAGATSYSNTGLASSTLYVYRVGDGVKVKGMFVRAGQIDGVVKRFPEVVRWQAVVTRENHLDRLEYQVELSGPDASGSLATRLAEALRDEIKVKGDVRAVPADTIPQGAKRIDDRRVWK